MCMDSTPPQTSSDGSTKRLSAASRKQRAKKYNENITKRGRVSKKEVQSCHRGDEVLMKRG